MNRLTVKHGELDEIRKVFSNMKSQSAGDGNREIVFAPCLGAYHQPSSWTISVNGSPPRGTLFLALSGNSITLAIFTNGWLTRKVSRTNKAILERVYERFLKGRTDQFFAFEEREAHPALVNGVAK